jgi:hypothetical protein
MRPAFFAFLALLAPLCFCGQAAAQPVQPLDRLLPEIRRTHPGQFYDADGPHPGAGGSQHYHLKWMTPDGRIVWYDTDARTGRVLGASPGRDNFDPTGEFTGRRPYERRGDVPPVMPRGNYRDDPQQSFGSEYGGRWSGPRVDGPRGNGQVYGGPGFDDHNYGGAFGGGRYGDRGYRGGYNHGGGNEHGGGGGGHARGGR